MDDLVIVADALLWTPRNPGGFWATAPAKALCPAEDLSAVIRPGQWLGIAKLREALPLARDGAHSPPETLLRLRLAEAGLPEPELNADIYSDTAWLANADLLYREFMVSVEYQGAHHRAAQQYQADIDRQFRVREAGWITVELTAHHVLKAPQEGVRRVRAALAQRGWRPQP